MSTQLLIRLDEDLKKKVSVLARQEGKTASQIMRSLLEGYVKEHDKELYMEELWQRVGGELKRKGKTLRDVNRAIRAVRKEHDARRR